MSKVILIHPGATQYDLENRIQGTLGIPLSEEGREEVRHTMVSLANQGIDVIYTSPCEAAVETAEMLAAALDIKVKTIDNLRNVQLGLWEGMLVEDVKTKQPKVYRQWQEHPDNICPPEGEMLTAARKRVEKTMAKLTRKHRDQVMGLVVPEPLASLVRAYFSAPGEELGDLWKPAATGSWESISPVPAA